MSSEIYQFVETCGVCTIYADEQVPEPPHLHDVPSNPWQKIGTDLFTWVAWNYLVTFDFYCRFFEIDYLPDIASSTVISKLKHPFATHGIPDMLVSDKGTQFTSGEFN